ncbi:MAG TPA: SDR family NAD(P)-dependent oxidoreductase [Gemmatimonadaceae bacterium]
MTPQSEIPFAVVTGASSGIGYELTRQFAEHGFDLLITSETKRIEETAQRLRELGAQVEAVRANLATYEGVESLYAQIRAMRRPIDVIVINAGAGVGGTFTDNEVNAELNLVALNVTAVVHLTKRVVKDMVARDQGHILFTTSIDEGPARLEAVQTASKAFVLSFAGALANELKDTNVGVTALQPGARATDFFHRVRTEDTRPAAEQNRELSEPGSANA